MKIFNTFILILLLTIIIPYKSFGQDIKTKKTETKDSLRNYLLGHDTYTVGYIDEHTPEFINQFKNTMPKGFNELSTPRFLIVGNKNNFLMGIGGRVLVNTGYGFNNDIPSSGFVTAYIPSSKNPRNDQRYIADVGSSRLVFRFLTTKKKFDSFEALIETDFNGNASTLRLRKAYVKFMGIKAGLDYSVFVDTRAVPSSVDTEGPNGVTSGRNIMLSYSRELYKGIHAAIGIEKPVSQLTYANEGQKSTQRIPDIPISFGYNFKDKISYLRIAAVFKGISYYNTNQNDIINKMGWGLTFSGSMRIIDNLTSYFGALYGKGIGNYINDLSYLNYDMLPTESGELNPTKMLGYHIGFKYDFPHNISLSTIYSEAMVFENETVMMPDYYKMARYLTVDCIWQPVSALNVGIGYTFGQRQNFDDHIGGANRIMAMIQYNF